MALHTRTSTLVVGTLLAFGGATACHGDQTTTVTTATIEDLPGCGAVATAPEVLAAPATGAAAAVDGDLLIAHSQIYRRTSIGWKPEADIVLPDGTCCLDVALSGEAAVVLARVDGVTGAGPAYVLDRESGAWSATALSLSYSSRTVALSNGVAAVGCHGHDPILGCQAPFGTVGIYERVTGAWTETALLQSDSAECMFGDSVALSGDTLVVGEGPRAHVFVRDGTTWVKQGLLEAEGADGHVAVNGNVAVLGRRPMHVFHRVDGIWEHAAELHTLKPEACKWMALRGGCLAAGAPLADTPGEADLFEWSRTGWKRAATFTSGETAADGFGTTVSLSDQWLVVGGLDAAWSYAIAP